MTSTRRTGSFGLTLAALAVVCAGVVACDDGQHGGDFDAERYYQEYEESSQDSGPVFATGVQEDGAAAPAPTPTRDDVQTPVPGLGEDNTFVDAGTSGFVATAGDPLSTFALDVDNGSWNVARTLLEQGQAPPPSSIRVEEWVNAQTYGDAAPTDEALAVTASTRAGQQDLARVAVTGREADLDDLPPLKVTLVVDRSGSMDIRERLGLVQTSMALMAENLRPQDSVAMVGFDDRAETLLEPTPVSETDTIVDAIDELTPRASTNLEAGLRQGYDVARGSYDPEAINVVVLCSDGVANVGETGPGSLVDRIQREGADGIHLVTAGFGMGNYNDHLMEQLADRGDGFYAYVDTPAEARELFVENLSSTLAPIAREAKVQVELDPELVEAWRQVGYENRQLEDSDFDDASVDAGEIGAGHRVSALYELDLVEGVEAGTEVGTATVRWQDPAGGPSRETETPILSGDPEASPDDDLELAAAVADFASVMKADGQAGDVSLADVRRRVADLDSRGVPGAADVLKMVRQAERLERR